MRDLILLLGIIGTIVGTIAACLKVRLYFAKGGMLVSGVAVFLGLANFGWMPLLGGTQYPDTYFGCTMLFMGLLGAALLGGVDEAFQRMEPAPLGERGFPVMIGEQEPRAGRAAPRG